MEENSLSGLKEKDKIALTLEGGGARGAYQVGALRALYENKFRFEAVVGTSIGAINAAFIAQGDFDKLCNMWETLSFKDLLNLDNTAMKNVIDKKLDKETVKYLSKMLGDSIKNGGLDVTSERKILESEIDENKIRNSQILYGLVTMCVSDIKGEELFISDIPDGKLIDYIMATSNLPIFKRVIIDDKKYLDGGAWDNCPVHMLEEKGYEDVVVIRAHKNIRIRNYKKILKRGKIRIHMISPVDTLPSILNFDTQNLNYQIDLGYFDTLKILNDLDGVRYYLNKFNTKIDKILNFDVEKIKKCLNAYHIKLKIGENVFDEGVSGLIFKLSSKTKNKNAQTLKEGIISIFEEIAILNDVEKFKIYDIKDFINIIKRCKITKNKYVDFKEFIELL